METLTIDCQGEALTLFSEPAVWWEREGVLLVADLHLGKPASFRASGIPVPDGTDRTDLERLSRLLTLTQAQKLIILGDLIHNRHSLTPTLIHTWQDWRAHHSQLSIALTLGNHDSAIPSASATLSITHCRQHLCRPPFRFQHHPEPHPDGYVIGGHIHPRVQLSTSRRTPRLSLPAYHFAQEAATLPAFGSFTGTHRIRAERGDRIIVLGNPQGLSEVPWSLTT